ncbi:hypothetical protein [Pseudoxanthomonas sp. UTMC 1351]|uniref:hypothetical protein n=1 Tax=Pseudoxanthomonas sp. UTMC 1351 TaxID=2695853 RepID=UPI0034CFCC5E
MSALSRNKVAGALIASFFWSFLFPASGLERAGTVADPSVAEIEKLEKLKDRTKNRDDYKKGSKAGHIDYIALFQRESRDEAWAPQAEFAIARSLSALPLESSGLSRPVVRCATNVCEIMTVQNAAGTENLRTNWQVLLVQLTKSEKLGVSVADSMVLTTSVDSERTGFVSYLLVDRGQPI